MVGLLALNTRAQNILGLVVMTSWENCGCALACFDVLKTLWRRLWDIVAAAMDCGGGYGETDKLRPRCL